MRPGRYAAADGSFGRSAGAAMGRGVIVIAGAVLLGIVLLNATDDEPPGSALRATGSSSDGGSVSVTTSSTVAPTTTVALRAPKDVKVVVANASGTKGVAARVSDLLKPPGYNVLSPTNAPDAKDSSVLAVAGYEREAAAIATALQLPSTVVKPLPAPAPIPDLRGANVLVIVGSDLLAKLPAAPTTTSTTAKAGTTGSSTASTTSTTARATGATTTAPPATTKKP